MRVIIMAAGEQSRWGNYLGVPKWLIPIDGEPLLYRTHRLLKERGVEDIIVTANTDFEGLRVERQREKEFECDRYYGARHLWKELNIHLNGDTYYTEEAMDKIVHCPNELQFFGQFNRNSVTGSYHCGMYGVKFPGHALVPHLEKFRELLRKEVEDWGTTWVLYRMMHGIPFFERRLAGNFTEIDDLTADFDFPYMYKEWMELRENRNLRDAIKGGFR